MTPSSFLPKREVPFLGSLLITYLAKFYANFLSQKIKGKQKVDFLI
jgi:hypothetical protein